MQNVSKKHFLISEIKSILDNANWDFQYNGDHGKDAQKACDYLNKLTFSEKIISEQLSEDYEDILYNAKHDDISEWSSFTKLCAQMIADILASSKVERFKGWSIGESVTFIIN